MISLFRSYNPVNVLWLALWLVVLRVFYMLVAPGNVEFVFIESFARKLVPVNYEHALNFSVNVLLAGMLVLVQAMLINYLVNHYNLLSKPTFLPALMYITLASLYTPFLTLSPPLICNFLVIWMLSKILAFYKGADIKAKAYDLGMIAALGSVIYFPFIYFVLAIWIAFIIFRPFDWRDWAASILGYATIFFFLAVFYYLNDHLHDFFKIWDPLGTRLPERITLNYYKYLLLIPVVLIIVLGMFKLQGTFFRSSIMVRKVFQLLFFIFLIGGLSFYVKPTFHLEHFLLCAVPLAIFFAFYFVSATTRWFYESLYFLLVAGIIYFQFNTF
ncbi:hypothetical protein C8P68_102326 [Mucilaginibacter yixingensis]|uniref:Beta-carotene 15,15'-monooxygenase n=1 Tax=Mucilaginibacter yixingensis TaxID=1295612 RepID=A0A2T5JCL8_9SPHI|nr:DUF6427 family protein [Mucilaginibacter yixingensis]PTQ99502.1 hypothetical protein C8P68_102326 [Mucilaginibacter yixingensis]